MIRAAIVGLGRWGRSLVRSVQGKSDEIEFIRAYTRTPAAAKEFCRDHNIAPVDSYDDIIRDSAVDAVVLATPHGEHAQQTMDAAAAGKHIFVEKPITLDLASANAAVAAAERAGIVLAVGFCRRFHPSIGDIRQHLKDGRLGRVIAIVAQHTTSTGQFIPPDNWRAAPEEAPGGRSRRRRALARSHDRVCGEGTGCALRCRPLSAGAIRRHDHDHAAVRERSNRSHFLFGRDRNQFQLHSLRHARSCGDIKAQSAELSLRARLQNAAYRGHQRATR